MCMMHVHACVHGAFACVYASDLRANEHAGKDLEMVQLCMACE